MGGVDETDSSVNRLNFELPLDLSLALVTKHELAGSDIQFSGCGEDDPVYQPAP